MTPDELLPLLETAVSARLPAVDDDHQTAHRLFNGFYEGAGTLAIDLYATTIVIHNYADPPDDGRALVDAIAKWIPARLPWVTAVLHKPRHAPDADDRCGELLFGSAVDTHIREHDVRYAIDLTMNQDASFYLDTRHVRRWALDNLRDLTVLNTFAYTGSLGVAATAGGARRVIHTDLNKSFLNVGKTSYTLNGFPINKKDFRTADFWSYTKQLNRHDHRFDCVILDPPFFSQTRRGVIDLAKRPVQLINKLRPIVKHNGRLLVINNALFLSGRAYMAALDELCADGYVSVEETIPVPDDFIGFPETRRQSEQDGAPLNPFPFNHSTKVVVLRVRHQL